MYPFDCDDDDDAVVMFVLAPDASNVNELCEMGLTLTDLPLHTCQRDAVFLGEYIAHEVSLAHSLDKLSKSLELEKNLSNTLLYNMLPKQIADELRGGNTVAPKHHDNVSIVPGLPFLFHGIPSALWHSFISTAYTRTTIYNSIGYSIFQ